MTLISLAPCPFPPSSSRATAMSSPRATWRRAPGVARLGVLGALLLCDVARAIAPDALPVDGTVREGGIAVTRDVRGMQIQQTGDRAIVDWRSFDVGRGVSVRVLQPSGAAVLLNRVMGGTPSTIAGELSANGRVCLVNPNGIHITPDGAVSAAGFVAATLDITNDDFLGGNLRFGSLDPSIGGTVRHHGRITIEPGGFAALLGHRVEQTGTTRTLLGQTGLGVGQAIRLSPGQDAFLDVMLAGARAPADSAELIDRPAPGIVMTGAIEADGGIVQIAAPMATARGRYPLEAVSLAGVVRARNAFTRRGTIRIDGDGGIVRVSGRLDASSNEMRGVLQPGGTVSVSARQVMLENEGVDVSGALGGGQVRLTARCAGGPDTAGRKHDGRDPVVFVGPWARINASATYRGDAGDVRLASDGRVVFLGRGQALGAVPVPGPSQLTVVAEAVAPDAAHRDLAGGTTDASATPPVAPSTSPPVRVGAMYSEPALPPTWQVSRFASAAPLAGGQRSPQASAPAAAGGRASSQASAPAAAGGQGSSQTPAPATPGGPSPLHAFASLDGRATPDASDLPSLRWTPSPPPAPVMPSHSWVDSEPVGLTADPAYGSPRGARDAGSAAAATPGGGV